MTGVDKDLATLLDYAGWATTPASHKRAVKGVEAELSRLREERYEERILHDAWKRDSEAYKARWTAEQAKRRAAEARCARLQQALEAGANYLRKLSDPMCPPAIRQVALDHFAELNGEALAGPDTPADSPVPDETVVQLRASGWSEEKISASMIRAQERKQRRLTYPPPADSQEDKT